MTTPRAWWRRPASSPASSTSSPAVSVRRASRDRARSPTTSTTIPAPARSARWRWVKRIVGTALAAAAVGAAISKRHELAQAAKLLSHLNWGWLAVAIAFEVGSLVAFARLQRWLLLAGDVEVGLRSMVEIILAGNALSMSLPGGAAWALAWAEAFGLALLNWLESCACLVACILAVHGHVPWRGILVAYALTQVLASIPLTPGGIGVVEGGLTALLVAYGMPTQVALASVLLFRVVSFWGLVPIGWMAWAALTLPGRAAERDRPHPWAPHRHRHGAPIEHDPSRAPDRVFPPEPCVGCD